MKFWKYHGAGNDFVMVDQRETRWIAKNQRERIAHLCDRRFGIGADGLILLQNCPGYDFEMIYFNADGGESTMCGNGGRCIAAFAKHLGIVQGSCRFMAIDGEHDAVILPPKAKEDEDGFWVELKMGDVRQVERQGEAYILNTGSPHYVRFAEAIENLDMVAEGRAVRYSDTWKKEGINVNFIAENAKPSRSGQHNSGESFPIRTYERGVEDETFACGTGVTAAALASHVKNAEQAGDWEINLQAKGGLLSVRYHANGDGSFSNIWLCGPAVRVFEGETNLP